jgi:uncharacterized protein YlxW (UPF0749 family)
MKMAVRVMFVLTLLTLCSGCKFNEWKEKYEKAMATNRLLQAEVESLNRKVIVLEDKIVKLERGIPYIENFKKMIFEIRSSSVIHQ